MFVRFPSSFSIGIPEFESISRRTFPEFTKSVIWCFVRCMLSNTFPEFVLLGTWRVDVSQPPELGQRCTMAPKGKGKATAPAVDEDAGEPYSMHGGDEDKAHPAYGGCIAEALSHVLGMSVAKVTFALDRITAEWKSDEGKTKAQKLRDDISEDRGLPGHSRRKPRCVRWPSSHALTHVTTHASTHASTHVTTLVLLYQVVQRFIVDECGYDFLKARPPAACAFRFLAPHCQLCLWICRSQVAVWRNDDGEYFFKHTGKKATDKSSYPVTEQTLLLADGLVNPNVEVRIVVVCVVDVGCRM